MEVLYRSTRGNGSTVTASNAILKGLSEDGGLFVPDQIPVLDVPMEQLAQMSYQEVAYEVMSRFLTDFTEEELKKCIQSAYDKKFPSAIVNNCCPAVIRYENSGDTAKKFVHMDMGSDP